VTPSCDTTTQATTDYAGELPTVEARHDDPKGGQRLVEKLTRFG
jgi:hypothetical protein